MRVQIGVKPTVTAYFERALIVLALLFVAVSRIAVPGGSVDTALAGSVVRVAAFGLDAVYPTTGRNGIESGISVYGSWLGGDASQGSLLTGWYPPVPHVAVYVAGYPTHPGLSLTLEADTPSGLRTIVIARTDPGERWDRVVLELPIGTTRFRIRAVDGSSAYQGWLGVSLPSAAGSAVAHGISMLARAVGCAATAMCLSFFPGMLLGRRVRIFRSGEFIMLPGLGLLIVGGLIYWMMPFRAAANAGLTIIAFLFLLLCLYAAWRRELSSILDPGLRRALLVGIAVVGIALGRSLYSLGPAGELYGGTISRTFEPGDRSDSRISYHVVQLVLNHEQPYEPIAAALFAPYNFSSRGPIAGVAAAALVVIAHGVPPTAMPDAFWEPFDRQGFEAYRIAMFVFAASLIPALFGVITRIGGAHRAHIAVSIIALSPFIIHETLFTWPKLLAAALVCAASSLLVLRRPITSGLMMGLAYLAHPSALFAMLGFAGAVLLMERGFSIIALRRLSFTVVGLTIVLIAWRLVNGPHFSQDGFLQYVFMTGDDPAGTSGWLRSRFDSVANTLVPFWLLAFHSASPHINRLAGKSSIFVHIDFSYWSTLPFAIGLLYFIPFVRRAYDGARRAPLAFVALILLPFVAFAIYWGSAPTGMMREGLHWWFTALIGFTALTGYDAVRADELRQDLFWLIARGAEVLLVVVGLVMLDRRAITNSTHVFTDLAALTLIGLSILLASIAIWDLPAEASSTV